MLNRVTLIGHLGRNPELRQIESGIAVVHFSIATNEYYKDREGNFVQQTEWHEIVAWRDLAERAQRQLEKGSLVLVEGKLSTRKYTDKEGQERTKTEIIANTMRLLDKKDAKSEEPNQNIEAEDLSF